jgi:hypothetical protein
MGTAARDTNLGKKLDATGGLNPDTMVAWFVSRI